MFFYNYENQVLIGTILGGASLVKPSQGKNYHVSMRGQDCRWLQYKMEQMPTYFKNTTIRKYGKTFRCNSCCSEDLTYLYGIMYRKKRRVITMPILDSLKDIAFATWFLDGGSKTGRNRKNAYLNTTKFGKQGTSIICKFFNEVGMNCNVNYDGNRMKIVFTVTGTKQFMRIVSYHFPVFLHDRIN